jgi:hypothetical protein
MSQVGGEPKTQARQLPQDNERNERHRERGVHGGATAEPATIG